MPTHATPTRDGAELDRVLRELVDRRELTDLAARLGTWLDEKRFDEARTLFVEEATVTTPGGTSRGVDALADQARQNHGAERTHHVITNVLVELDGDRAQIAANLVATFVARAAEPAAHRALGGRYELEAVRTGEGWKLSSVRVEPVWQADGRRKT